MEKISIIPYNLIPVEENRPNHQLEQEAKSLITLGVLLQKKRHPDLKKKVEQIAVMNISTDEKINKIKELDKSYSNKEEKNDDEVHSLNIEKPEYPRTRVVKQFIEKANLFQFIFVESRMLKKFGKKTHTLEVRSFPPQIKLQDDISLKMIRLHQKSAKELWLFLNKVEKSGWLYLTKKRYNLFMVLRDLCFELMTTNFFFRKGDHRNLVARYKQMENSFLVLHSHPDYITEIERGLTALEERGKEFNSDIAELKVLINRLLLRDLTMPSLYNFILAINMIKARKYLVLKDLLRENAEKAVDTKEFNCSPQVERQIKAHIEKLVTALTRDKEQLKQYQKITSYLHEEYKKDNYPLLEKLYPFGTENGHADFTADINKMLVCTPNLLSGFVTAFEPFLQGRFTTDNNEVCTFTGDNRFYPEINLLDSVIERLKLLKKKTASFSRERFLSLKTSMSDAIAVEHDIYNEIERGAKGTRDILNKCIKQLENLEESKKTIFEHTKITDENLALLQGNNINAACVYIINTAFALLKFFRDREMSEVISNEEALKKEAAEKLKTLQRIGNDTRYQQMKTVFMDVKNMPL